LKHIYFEFSDLTRYCSNLFRWDGSFHHGCIENFLGNLSVKKFWKSVICRSYDQKSNIPLFWTCCNCIRPCVSVIKNFCFCTSVW